MVVRNMRLADHDFAKVATYSATTGPGTVERG